MLQEARQDEVFEGLPMVALQEPASTMTVLLTMVANQDKQTEPLETAVSWKDLLAIYEVANKYNMHLLSAYTQACLLLQMPNIPPVDALNIHLRAEIFNDKRLLNEALQRATTVPLKQLPRHPLQQMSVKHFMVLMQSHHVKLAERLEASVNGRNVEPGWSTTGAFNHRSVDVGWSTTGLINEIRAVTNTLRTSLDVRAGQSSTHFQAPADGIWALSSNGSAFHRRGNASRGRGRGRGGH